MVGRAVERWAITAVGVLLTGGANRSTLFRRFRSMTARHQCTEHDEADRETSGVHEHIRRRLIFRLQ
jgi:hypothetical protein